MNKKEKIILLMWLCMTVVCLFAGKVQAKTYNDSDPDDMITKKFDISVKFDRSHTASITEVIQVDFIKSHHGITRNIPVAGDNTYDIKNISVEKYKYQVESEGNNKIIRIGDKNRTITGEHKYTIHYQIEYYSDEDKKADFLAQNMLPTEWETSIRSCVLSLTMPESIDAENMLIYAGEYGSNDLRAWESKFDMSLDGNTMVLKGEELPRGYGVTVLNSSLKEGYWSEARSFLDAHMSTMVTIIVIAGILAILSFVLWLIYGRDKRITETVEFYPPEDITPAEIGYALDGELSDHEMMTMVIYLADKGYISITQQKKHFIFIKENDIPDDEPEYIKTFVNGMFKKKNEFNTKNTNKFFRKPLDDSKDEAKQNYEEKYKSVYTGQSTTSRYACVLFMAINMAVFSVSFDGFDGIYISIFTFIISLLGMMKSWKGYDNLKIDTSKGIGKILIGDLIYFAGVYVIIFLYGTYPVKYHNYVYLISQIIILQFSIIMQKRSDESNRIIGKIYGFRNFIKNAEYDRIRALSGSDPEYFYHILPYAAVLGLQSEWTKHFKDIRISEPSWYRGSNDMDMCSALWYSNMLSSCTRSAVPPTPSSGSSGGYSGGSSGGGFSGGGGGGGGGGGW